MPISFFQDGRTAEGIKIADKKVEIIKLFSSQVEHPCTNWALRKLATPSEDPLLKGVFGICKKIEKCMQFQIGKP
jgi:hypothetical protein